MLVFTHSVMGAGKSAILIAKASTNYAHSLIFKPLIDQRDGLTKIVSRNGSSIDTGILCFNGSFTDTLKILEIAKREKESSTGHSIKYIYVDEAQFLSEIEVEALLTFSLKYDIIIECYGLLTDFKSRLFEGSKRLIELADKIEHIAAYSRNGEIAKQNARVIDDKIIHSGEQILLGREEVYRAVSNREYWRNLNDNK